jgi:D-3-phosphoglycerate dehydrogenase
LFGYPNVIVTPHLGASTAEATERAGYQAAEQVVAALTGGVVTSAVNVPAIAAEDVDMLAPFVALCRGLGKVAIALAEGSSIDRVRLEFLGRIAERDTRLLSIHALIGVLSGHTEEQVGLVNAPMLAHERGIELVETKTSTAYDYSDLVRVSIDSGESTVRVAGTLHGRRHRPHLLEVWGQRFDVQLEHQITVFRYRDVPGMIGRVGTCFGEHSINIVSAAAGRDPDDSVEHKPRLQVMIVTTDSPVPQHVINELVATDGFEAGRTVTL